MVPGMIMLWHGSIETIPSGWAECNGTMGTPDLRNRFVWHPGMGNPQGNTGGADAHSHDFTGDGHVHEIPQEAGCPGAGPEPCIHTDNTGSSPAVGTTDSGNSIPPFMALYYIMKL